MKVVIIGAGITGLTAGYELSRRGYGVEILESSKDIGGLLGSYTIKNNECTYNIEKYYHHLFITNKNTIKLIKSIGIENNLLWLRAKTGYFIDGLSLPLDTPTEIISFPYLTLYDKILLLFLVLNAKITINMARLDEITAKDWVIKNSNEKVYQNFLEPLLRGKFGINMERVSAAWLVSRLKMRSNRGIHVECLGYLKGGFIGLVNCLAEFIIKTGNVIRTNSQVVKIITKDGIARGVKTENFIIYCDAIISTIPPRIMRGLCNIEVPDIPYQESVCMLVGTKKHITDDIYWLNIKENSPFGAIIEHTNFLNPSSYGEHIFYLASYVQNEKDPLWSMDDKRIYKFFLMHLSRMFPNFNKDDVNWYRISRDRFSAPIYTIKYKGLIMPYETNIKNLYIAGMFSEPNYPERSIEGCVRSGVECAEIVMNNWKN